MRGERGEEGWRREVGGERLEERGEEERRREVGMIRAVGKRLEERGMGGEGWYSEQDLTKVRE